MNRTHWVMDYETLLNCFIAVFEDIKSKDREIFVIHKERNDCLEFITFLERNILFEEWHVSFNGIGFDAQVTEHILENKDQLLEMSGEEVALFIYGKAQDTIQRQNEGEWAVFAPWTLQIKQVDVFKLNHWDNAAKRTSLKWAQFSMDWQNIQDMPIHHSTEIKTLKQIDSIIDYCINDVASTKAIMYRSKKQIALRQELTKEYNIDLFSASEPRIAKELFAMFLSKKTGIKKYDLKKMRTYRSKLIVNDLLLPNIKFETATFQRLVNKFRDLELDPHDLKGSFKYSVRYKGITTHFGLGGVHGARKDIYTSNDEYVIMSSDVTSFYPNLAIRNKWSPAHLPKEDFCDQYEWFFNERKKIPKSDPRNYVYKIVLNSTYGLSNDENSFLYDPELTMRITLNGQLSLMMLYEMICERIPNAVPLMQNTDGLETRIPRKYVDKYMEICKEWEDITNLQLEHDAYQKVILADVNNYIALKEGKDFKTKAIGRFVFEDLPLHKNKSFLCVRKAMYDYFIFGKDPEQSIKENTNIFDFCGGVKAKGDWKFFEESVVNTVHQKTPLQKTVRYYISNRGSKTVKIHSIDGRVAQVEAGKWLQTMFINYIKKPFNEYDINYDFYIKKAKKEIEALEPKTNQLQLF
tara:strand:- start:11252 stop:13159 length:1908 start_codon:yes stop_codon:yes gene_type:complete